MWVWCIGTFEWGDTVKISNWDHAKKQAITKLPGFTITAAVIFLIATFIAFWNGSIDYREQMAQSDWTVTEATVSYVYEYYDAFHSHNGGGHTIYDVHYEYYVDGQVYTGIIEEQHTRAIEGSTFEIKYNPGNPEENTRILEPSKSYLISGSVFGTLCLSMLVTTVVLIRKGNNK